MRSREAWESWKGGCPYVGDICGSRRAFTSARQRLHGGVCYLEVMGHGDRLAAGMAEIEWVLAQVRDGATGPGPGAGLSPHAPYSAAPDLYEAAAEAGLPVATHLAESREELEWCRAGTGLFADMLIRFGYRPGEVRHPGEHPVDAFTSAAIGANGLNDLDPDTSTGSARYHGHLLPRPSRCLVILPTVIRRGMEELLAAAFHGARNRRTPLPAGPARSNASPCSMTPELVAMEPRRAVAAHGHGGGPGPRPGTGSATLAPGAKAGLIAIAIEDGSMDRPMVEAEIDWLIRLRPSGARFRILPKRTRHLWAVGTIVFSHSGVEESHLPIHPFMKVGLSDYIDMSDRVHGPGGQNPTTAHGGFMPATQQEHEWHGRPRWLAPYPSEAYEFVQEGLVTPVRRLRELPDGDRGASSGRVLGPGPRDRAVGADGSRCFVTGRSTEPTTSTHRLP